MARFETPPEVLEILSQKFNILGVTSFLQFDRDWSVLRSWLQDRHQPAFHHNDRIIVEKFDTDFYMQGCEFGINLMNFFSVVKEIDIPYFVFVFYTNHHGLQSEIDFICQQTPTSDRPTVIESLISTWHYNHHDYVDTGHRIEDISHHSLCMMNMTRGHRHATYHAIKNLGSDRCVINAVIHK